MTRIYRASEVELIEGGGYSRRYIADVHFRFAIKSAGLINVHIPGGIKTQPHAHTQLEEIFIIMGKTRMGVGDQIYELTKGDIVVADPGEAHWFETYPDQPIEIFAIKCPNIKDDKVMPE